MNKKIIIYITFYLIIFLISISLSKLYFDNNIQKIHINNLNENNILNNNTTKITKNNINNVNTNTTKKSEIIKDDEQTIDNTFNIKLSFAGDTMLASYKDQTTPGSFNEYVNKKEPSYFLDKVRNIFLEDDFTIVNLENVLTDQNLPEIEKNSDPAYWYKSKTSNINILSSSSIEGISISNNHTNDYGKIGKEDTINAILNANIKYGDYNNIMYFKKNNYKIAVICKGLWIESQTNEIIKLIKEAKEKSDYQIIFFHGGQERIHQPEEWKINAVRKLIDTGANLVIGSHPHVLQPREIYNGKEIVYSLGNFCYGGNRNPENRTIIYQMNLTINKETNSLINEKSNIIPCYVYTNKTNNYQPAPIQEENIKNKVIDFMNWKEDSPI